MNEAQRARDLAMRQERLRATQRPGEMFGATQVERQEARNPLLAANDELRGIYADDPSMNSWLNEREARILGIDTPAATPAPTPAMPPAQSLFAPPRPEPPQPAPSLFTPSPPQQQQQAPPAPPPAPPSLFTAPSPAPPAPPPLPVFTPPPPALPRESPFQNVLTEAAPVAPPPSTTFLEQARTNIAPPPTQAIETPVGPAPARVPIMTGPSAGLLQAQAYSAAPSMPGYGEARSGAPFTAPPKPIAAAIDPLLAMINANQQSVLTEEEKARRAAASIFGNQYYPGI